TYSGGAAIHADAAKSLAIAIDTEAVVTGAVAIHAVAAAFTLHADVAAGAEAIHAGTAESATVAIHTNATIGAAALYMQSVGWVHGPDANVATSADAHDFRRRERRSGSQTGARIEANVAAIIVDDRSCGTLGNPVRAVPFSTTREDGLRRQCADEITAF